MMNQTPEITFEGTVMANINNCWVIENNFGHFDIATDANIKVGDHVKLTMSDTNPTINHYGVKLILENIYIDPLKTAKLIFQHAFFNFDLQKLLNSRGGVELYNNIGRTLFSMDTGDTCTWTIENKYAEEDK